MKKMKVKLDELELTETNIRKLFVSCMDETKHPACAVNLYSYKSDKKPVIMYLDHNKIWSNVPQIEYLLGQLKVVHDRKDSFSISEGFYNYNGKKWTSSSENLALLYFLGIADSSIIPFQSVKGQLTAKLVGYMKPTYFPPLKCDADKFILEE